MERIILLQKLGEIKVEGEYIVKDKYKTQSKKLKQG